MDVTTLARRLGEVQLVDVRYPNEWEAGRIDGALHIERDYLYERLDKLDRDRPVVTVCRTGNRSQDAASFLQREGFAAESLDGGMEAWAAAGNAVTTPGGDPGRVVEPEPPVDDRPADVQELQSVLLQTFFAVEQHFQGREASDEEIRAFLRDRLVAEGRSPEEADSFLRAMDEPSAP